MLIRMQMRAEATAALIVTLVLRAAASLPLVRLCVSSPSDLSQYTNGAMAGCIVSINYRLSSHAFM